MASECIEFTVLGTPQPQGSIKAFMVGGKARLTSDNAKMKPYRQQVGQVALAERAERDCFEVWAGRHVAVAVQYDFYFAKPKSARKARTRPAVRPDIDKLVRSTSDALTGILWPEDGAVVSVTANKWYGLPERAEIKVWKVEAC